MDATAERECTYAGSSRADRTADGQLVGGFQPAIDSHPGYWSSAGLPVYDVRTKSLGKLVHLPTKGNDIDPVELAWTENDTRIVWFTGDSAHPRAEFFDLDGNLQHSVPVPGDYLMISPNGRYLSLPVARRQLVRSADRSAQAPTGHVGNAENRGEFHVQRSGD